MKKEEGKDGQKVTLDEAVNLKEKEVGGYEKKIFEFIGCMSSSFCLSVLVKKLGLSTFDLL